MIYKKIKILFNKKELFKLYLILFGCIVATLFEVVGIGSIPIFAMAVTDVNSLNPYLPKFIPSDFLLGIDNKEIVFIGALILGFLIFSATFGLQWFFVAIAEMVVGMILGKALNRM